MADSINRIIPATLAPELVAVPRRERDKNERGGAEGRERERQERGAAPAEPAEVGVPKDQLKGNRVDISV